MKTNDLDMSDRSLLCHIEFSLNYAIKLSVCRATHKFSPIAKVGTAGLFLSMYAFYFGWGLVKVIFTFLQNFI